MIVLIKVQITFCSRVGLLAVGLLIVGFSAQSALADKNRASGPTLARIPQLNIMTAHDQAQLEMLVCMDHEYPSKIVIADKSLLQSSQELNCKTGPAKLSISDDKSDPGHVLIVISPPKGDKRGFECTGKASTNAPFIGLNCLEADRL